MSQTQPNQYNTRCSVEIYEGNQLRRIKYFSDLQLAHMYIEDQLRGQALRPHRNEFIHPFHEVVEFLQHHPYNGVIVARTEEKSYEVSYMEE